VEHEKISLVESFQPNDQNLIEEHTKYRRVKLCLEEIKQDQTDKEVKPDAAQDTAPATTSPGAPPPEGVAAWEALAGAEAVAVAAAWGED